jgi:ribA/ribD-fused uncharacterized protein
MLHQKIDSFSGYHDFLSNFFPDDIWIKGKAYRTLEHAFQAAKHTDPVFQEQIRLTREPGAAKRLARSKPARDNWDYIKVGVMLELLRMKFADPRLRAMLLDTGDLYLEEGNTWGDEYWGTVKGVGKNMLGHLLMQVRKELKKTKSRTEMEDLLNPASIKCDDQNCSNYRNMRGGCDLCGAPCL